ncbi:hypothetical protein Micbo1qcDRAFT_159512, partial [Microdochium bolleyi]
MCLASRPEPLLARALGHYPQLRLEKLNRSDLERYARSTIVIPPYYQTILGGSNGRASLIFNDPHFSSTGDLASWLSATLVEKAEGIFLWLRLTVEAVSQALQ